VESRISKAVELESRGNDRKPFLRFLDRLSSDQQLDVQILKGRVTPSGSKLVIQISGTIGGVHRALSDGRKWLGTPPAITAS
jgi:hypothetical protein